MTRSALIAAFLATSFAGALTAAPFIIDDGDVGASVNGDFYNSVDDNDEKSVNGDYWWAAPNTGGANAYYGWQFQSVTPGQYDVYVHWTENRPNWALGNNSVTYYVVDGALEVRGYPDWDISPAPDASLLDFVMVDQSVSPSGFEYDGYSWFKLGTYDFTSDTISILLTNETLSGSGSVLADAAMIVLVPEPASLGVIGAVALLALRRRRD